MFAFLKGSKLGDQIASTSPGTRAAKQSLANAAAMKAHPLNEHQVATHTVIDVSAPGMGIKPA
jgi:hypothetical protein